MKKFLSLIFVVVTIATTAFAQDIKASYGDDSRAIGVARAEVQSTCLAGTGEINSSAWQDVDGNWYVYFYHSYRCQPNEICPMYFRIAPLARVTLDANYNVLSASCGFLWYELL
jgi:hypothetical protein